jgi:hypothetical protein
VYSSPDGGILANQTEVAEYGKYVETRVRPVQNPNFDNPSDEKIEEISQMKVKRVLI